MCEVEDKLNEIIHEEEKNYPFLAFLGIRLASIQQHSCYITAMIDVISSTFMLPRSKVCNALTTNKLLFEKYSNLKIRVINSITNEKSIFYDIVNLILGSSLSIKKDSIENDGRVTTTRTIKINQSISSSLFKLETIPHILSISSTEQELSSDKVIPILKEDENIEVHIVKKLTKKKIENRFDSQQKKAQIHLFDKYSKYKVISAGGAVRCGKTVLMTHEVLKRIEYIYQSSIDKLKDDFDDDQDRSKGQIVFLGKTAPSCFQNVFCGVLEQWKLNIPAMKSFVWNILNYNIRILGIGKLALESLKGITADIIYVDEAENLTEDSYRMLLSRLSNPWAKLYLCWNPMTPSHWLSKLMSDRDKIEKSSVRHYNFSLDKCDFACKKYVSMLENNYGKGSAMYKRFVLGEPASVSGTVYSMFNEDKCCINNEIDLSIYNEFYIGYDHGHRSPRVYIAIGIYVNENGISECHVLDELYYPHGHCDSMTYKRYMNDLELFTSRFKDKLRFIYIPHDAMDVKHSLHPFYEVANASKKFKVLDGIGLIQIMFSDGRLKIHNGCKNLIRELYLYSYKENNSDDTVTKEFDHACDALRYAITSCNIFRRKVVNEEDSLEII